MELSSSVQIPPSLYVVVGLLVIGNFGVIISMLTLIFKAGMFVSTTKAGIEDAKSTAVRAHKRIDKIEDEAEA
jgi:hypothetical protein